MDKRKRFALISAVLIVLLIFLSVKKTDVFPMAFIAVPTMLYFVGKGIACLYRIIRRREAANNLVMLTGCVVGFFAVFLILMISTREISKLTQQRKAILQEIRPVFMKYKQDYGSFPKTLNSLVPDYIPEIPPVLIYNDKDRYYYRIQYNTWSEKGHEHAGFHFHGMTGPDSGVGYDIEEDKFEYHK